MNLNLEDAKLFHCVFCMVIVSMHSTVLLCVLRNGPMEFAGPNLKSICIGLQHLAESAAYEFNRKSLQLISLLSHQDYVSVQM